jgi:hypothetical protein
MFHPKGRRTTKQAVAEHIDKAESRKLASIGLKYAVAILRATITWPYNILSIGFLNP